MNREQKRNSRILALAKLKGAKAYVVVAWDGKTLPKFYYDVSTCKNEDDIRHFIMQAVAQDAEELIVTAHTKLSRQVTEKELPDKVAEYKEKRSKELSKEL